MYIYIYVWVCLKIGYLPIHWFIIFPAIQRIHTPHPSPPNCARFTWSCWVKSIVLDGKKKVSQIKTMVLPSKQCLTPGETMFWMFFACNFTPQSYADQKNHPPC